jgi:hypothetical protein
VTVAPVTANLAGVSPAEMGCPPNVPVGRPPEAPHDPPAITTLDQSTPQHGRCLARAWQVRF